MEKENNQRTNELLLNEFEHVAYSDWKRVAELSLKGKPFEKLIGSNYEEIEIQPIYNMPETDKENIDNNFPGFPPFRRSTNFLGEINNSEQVSAIYDYPSVEEINKALKFDCNRGLGSIGIMLDEFSAYSKNINDSVKFIINSKGVNLTTIKDFEILFDGIDLSKYPVYFENINSLMPIFALFTGYLSKNNINLKTIKGGFSFCPLSVLERHGTCIYDIQDTLTEHTSMIGWTKKNLPNFKFLNIDAYIYNSAGASAVQELAFAFSKAVFYLEEFQERGLELEDILKTTYFTFGIGSDFFMEIAKFRAARILWSKIIESYGLSSEFQKISLHARSSYINNSKLDVYNNLLRNTNEAMAALMGNCDRIVLGNFSDVFGLPDEFSRRISRSTQLILKEECNLKNVIDPEGGSWYIEYLTDSLVKRSFELFMEIINSGGYLNALLKEIPQNRISKTANERLNNLFLRKDILIGVNKSANLNEQQVKLYEFDSNKFYKDKYFELQNYLRNRKIENFDERINDIEKLKLNDVSRIDLQINLAIDGITIGELSDLNSKNTSTPILLEPIEKIRLSEKFELLRNFSENYKLENGIYPKIFLINIGTIKQYKARADFISDFVQIGGFEVINPQGFNTNEEGANAFFESGCKIAVICSTDEKYIEIVPDLIMKIKSEKPTAKIFLAGYPKEYIEDFKIAGIDGFIHIKSNIIEVLSNLQDYLEN